MCQICIQYRVPYIRQCVKYRSACHFKLLTSKQIVGISRFVLIRDRVLFSVISKVICLYSAGVVGMSFLNMHTTMPCFCCSMIRPSKNIRLKMACKSYLMLSQLNLKISRQVPSLHETLSQAPLITAVFSSSLVTGVSRNSLNPSGKIL